MPSIPVAKAVYFLEGDENAENAHEYQSMVIEHEGSLWLVATWLRSNATGENYPERIVPMEKLPHVVRPDGLFVLNMLMPKQLVSDNASPQLLRKYGAVTHPDVAHIPGPFDTEGTE